MSACVQCGNPLRDNDKFCSKCGATSQNTSTPDQPDENDVVPINGPARYTFHLANLSQVRLPGWPPTDDMILASAEEEIRRYWEFISTQQIWSPYPILSYSLGAATYRGSELMVRYFLFPVPAIPAHAVLCRHFAY
ncbi:MAG TPA: zinc ribbon domain-containing protein [Pyrinomonadaceae bacterium]|nr:zinc ribbon domain-containing protein [Pyrinomonadaceae bacterium]